MSNYEASGLFKVLPHLGFNPFDEMEGLTERGLFQLIFPNGGMMASWFKGFSENSLKGLGIFSVLGIVGKLKTGSILDMLSPHAPIGLPNIVTKSGKGK